MSVAKMIDCRISLEAREDDVEDRRGHRLLRILLEPSEDVLHVDDRVVHELADGHGQPAERHRVDRRGRTSA